MITAVTYRLQAKETFNWPTIHLAPFGVAEAARYVPVDPSLLPHESIGGVERYAGTPDDFVARRAGAPASTWMGIYDGEVSTESFVGMLGLRPYTGTPLGHKKPVQEVGTLIIPESARGRSLGTVAKVGAVAFAREHQGTHVFLAMVSGNNRVAPRSLKKSGFIHTATEQRHEYPDGAPTQTWTLADPEGLATAGAASAEEAARLAEGWREHERVLGELSIRQV